MNDTFSVNHIFKNMQFFEKATLKELMKKYPTEDKSDLDVFLYLYSPTDNKILLMHDGDSVFIYNVSYFNIPDNHSRREIQSNILVRKFIKVLEHMLNVDKLVSIFESDSNVKPIMYSLDVGVLYVIAALSPSVKLDTLDINKLYKYNKYRMLITDKKDIALGLTPDSTDNNELVNDAEMKAIKDFLDKNFKPPSPYTHSYFCAISISDIQSMTVDKTITIDNTKRKYYEYEQSMTFLYHLFNDQK